MMPEGNLAEGYIKSLQKNPNKMDTMNTSIKKYNKMPGILQKRNLDMAKMPLKKVLSQQSLS